MRIIIAFILTLFFMEHNQAQNPFDGTYFGTINGDNVTLSLQHSGNNQLNGKMNDSQQNYIVEAQTNGKTLTGTAKENTYGLTFQLSGTLENNLLSMQLTMNILGQINTQNVVFTKQTQNQAAHSTPSTNKLKMPSGAHLDAALIGNWQQSETYSSGYGDNFFAGSSVSNIHFLADGSIADGGSQATISGSSYYGNSGKSDVKKVPNVIWYTQNSHIYLLASENGQSQTVDVGKYYIENGNMLITTTNGKKVLLKKQ